MTKHRPGMILLLVLTLGSSAFMAVLAQEAAGTGEAIPAPPPHPKGPHHPPKNLRFIDGHWTPYDPPKIPEGAQAHVIQPGDTLWDLSGKFLGNPMLWPQLWDQNRYILDSHWIYPGDPLLIPAPPTVVPPEIAEEPPPEEPEKIAAVPPAPQPVALADKWDLYCSSYIDNDWKRPAMRVAAMDEGARVSHAEGDVVYINRGSSEGVSAGDEFDIVRALEEVRNPVTRKNLGTRVGRIGRLQVIAVQPSSATAEIVFSCSDVHLGDRLHPKWDPEVPMGFPAGPMDRYGRSPSGKAAGVVVAADDDLIAVGQGNVIQIDLGAGAGLKPGDLINIFRPNEAGSEYARKELGTGLILTVRPTTAAVKITESVREIYVGDQVEIR